MGPLPANGCMAIRTFARSKINPIGPWPNQNLIKQYDTRYTQNMLFKAPYRADKRPRMLNEYNYVSYNPIGCAYPNEHR